jgi:cardiolipin synthase A/B
MAPLLLVVAVLFLAGCARSARIDPAVPRLYTTDSTDFDRAMSSMLGRPILDGNRFQALHNGVEIFPAMLEAIRSAQRSITFETYIYWSGQTGADFAAALAERAAAGVPVHVLIDWVGSSRMDSKHLSTMEDAGVEIRKFRPLRWYNLHRLNHRTHRKLLVVDGRIGFTGGVGIADPWQGDAQDAEHWRDSHYRVEGPVVAQMQAIFMDNWRKVSSVVLHGDAYYPRLTRVGEGRGQMFSSSPAEGSAHMKLMYLMAITAAQRSIHLSSAYFIPDTRTRKALVDALTRGVRVQIIAPGPVMDSEIARRASRALWGELLEAGAEIHEFQPTMFHCKVMIVDAAFATVGSTNFDPRSFELNDEASLNIYEPAFAAQEIRVFERDLLRSRRITLEQWRERPPLEKFWENAAALMAPQL